MDADALRRLTSPAGEQALALAGRMDAGDPLAAAQGLRAAGVPADLAGVALTQVELRRRAAGKFGADAVRLFYTRAGLEQATRHEVARRRAERLAATGVTRLADLGCGIGADAIAFGRAGLRVLAVESDPPTALVAAANVAALGLSEVVLVHQGDATAVDLSQLDAVFCDPARRDPARGRRLTDPARYSPPWSFVAGLAQQVPATVLKLAPGLDHALIPPAAEAEWVSVDGDLVEAALWFGPLRRVARRATVLRRGTVHELTGSGRLAAPVGAIRAYLFDPDPAVVRSHLVAEFAAEVGGVLADPHIAYVFADEPVHTPLGRCLEVVEPLPFARKRLRAALRDRGIGVLEIRSRGLAVDPDRLRRDLGLAGPGQANLVLARLGTTPTALLCRPALPATTSG